MRSGGFSSSHLGLSLAFGSPGMSGVAGETGAVEMDQVNVSGSWRWPFHEIATGPVLWAIPLCSACTISLDPHNSPVGQYHHCTHFTDDQTEAQRGGVACLRSHRCQADPLKSDSHWDLFSIWWRMKLPIDFVPPENGQQVADVQVNA